MIGASIVIFGLIGGTSAGYLLKKYQKYKKSVLLFHTMAIITFISFVGAFFLKNSSLILTISLFFGFFNIGMTPLFVDFANEVTFPSGEAMTMGVMHTFN